MASLLYPKAKEQLLQAGINLSSADVRAVLVDLADYTYSATHEFLSSVPAGARIATLSAGVGSKTFTNGVFRCAAFTFSSVAAGDAGEAVIFYVHTGSDATARLLALIEHAPVTPNGGNITFTPDAGPDGVFAL